MTSQYLRQDLVCLPTSKVDSPIKFQLEQGEFVNLGIFFEMIRMCRPARSKTEKKFIKKYIVPTGALPDTYGNYILKIGEAPVLWSCHTDTVHKNAGVQSIQVIDDFIKLPPNSPSNCLGADCTTGVWIMLQMIHAKVEGLYIFHRDEEIGGKGSQFISNTTPEILTGINFAIAFDRFGLTSVITQQMCGKCCSQLFVDSIAKQLPPGYRSDTGGTFTDTANYTDKIPECTNLSVGYYDQHFKSERQSISQMFALRDAMIKLVIPDLVVDRLVTDKGTRWYYRNDYESQYDYADHYYNGRGYTVPKKEYDFEEEEDDDKRYDEFMSMTSLVKKYPDDVADILESYGINVWELAVEIRARRRIG